MNTSLVVNTFIEKTIYIIITLVKRVDETYVVSK